MPRVIEMAHSAGSDNCPVFGPLDAHIAEDKQRCERVLPSMPDFAGSEDHLGPVCRCSLDLDMLDFVSAAADQVEALAAMDILDGPCLAIELGGHVHRANLHCHLYVLVQLESLPSPRARYLSGCVRHGSLGLLDRRYW